MNTTKISQAETAQLPKRRGRRFLIGCFTLLLGLPLLYYGYCWGLWGRHSLLLQYLFQCNCPRASEEARYSRHVDVIVSACQHVTSSRLSPSGHLLYVREEDSGLPSRYILDLQTGEKISSALPDSDFYFLNDNLLYVSYGGEEYILNRTTEDQFPIRRFIFLYPDAYVNGDVNLRLLAEALRGAKYVFWINDEDTVIALASDFPDSTEHGFITGWFDIPGFGTNRVEHFLNESNIVYQVVPDNFPHEVVSPDGKFLARDDGIYLVETDRRIVKAPYSFVKGWISDGRGVVYALYGRCLIRRGLPFMDDVGCEVWVPQPVLLLKVPEEYLVSTKMP